MATKNFLAIDLGAESGRAVVGSFDGEHLTLREVHRFPNLPVRVAGHLHWDALKLFDEIQHALEAAAKQFGEIASIGVDTWGVDFALLDASGALIGNPVHYRDHRTDGMMAQAFQRVPRERIFESTGIQFMQLNTLYQLFAMAQANAPALRIADTLLLMPDLFDYWLTGEKVSEFTIATTTQFYDPRAGDWARPLLDELGIPHAFLPRIVPSSTDLGALLPHLARETGLTGTRVIAPACHDTGSAVAAVPARVPNYAYISSGTWSLMGVEVRKPIIDARSLRFNFTNEGGAAGTFQLLKNLTGLWLVQGCRRAWAREGNEVTYDELMTLAKNAPRFAAFVDPDHTLFLNPDDMPIAIAQYCRETGQKPPADRGATIRCVLESLALKYHHTLDQLETLLAEQIQVIHIVGGGSQNQLLCQFAADACARPVLAGPIEATALGNILSQMLAQKIFASLEEARSVGRASFPLTSYEPRNTSAWVEAYAQFSKRVEPV